MRVHNAPSIGLTKTVYVSNSLDNLDEASLHLWLETNTLASRVGGGRRVTQKGNSFDLPRRSDTTLRFEPLLQQSHTPIPATA